MKLAIAFAALLLATSALPCSRPATGTLADLMQQATWTERTGSNFRARAAVVRIALPAIGSGIEAFRCLTWEVSIVLPSDIGLKADGDGNAGATSLTGLASSATAEFDLALPAYQSNSVRDWRAWLRVKAHYPGDDADVYLSRPDGGHVWLYPVTIQLGG